MGRRKFCHRNRSRGWRSEIKVGRNFTRCHRQVAVVRYEMPGMIRLRHVVGVALPVNYSGMLVNPECEDISARNGDEEEDEHARNRRQEPASPESRIHALRIAWATGRPSPSRRSAPVPTQQP